VGALQGFNKALPICVAASVAREKHNGSGCFIQDAICHRKLDHLVNGDFPTCSTTFLLVYLHPQILEAVPEGVTIGRDRSADVGVIKGAAIQDEVEQMPKVNSKFTLVTGFTLMADVSPNEPDI
jgi:hypothetical protein